MENKLSKLIDGNVKTGASICSVEFSKSLVTVFSLYFSDDSSFGNYRKPSCSYIVNRLKLFRVSSFSSRGIKGDFSCFSLF